MTDLRDVCRRLAALWPDEPRGPKGRPLELDHVIDVPARMVTAESMEGHAIRRRRVEGEPEAMIAAFLDGKQQSHVERYVSGIPIVAAEVSAVVRRRVNRRLTTWRFATRAGLYAPLELLPADVRRSLGVFGTELHDTSTDLGEAGAAFHPFAVTDAAIHVVQRARERLETELAVEWCTREREPIYVDGSIAGDPRVAGAAMVVGVVKSHRVIYGGTAAYRAIVELRPGERTSVLRTDPAHERRSPVATWYLRLRDVPGGDPFRGLVRVEIPLVPGMDPFASADRVSRWVLAEAAPLSLPDARWDTMAYGIRDCEEFLRAVRA